LAKKAMATAEKTRAMEAETADDPLQTEAEHPRDLTDSWQAAVTLESAF